MWWLNIASSKAWSFYALSVRLLAIALSYVSPNVRAEFYKLGVSRLDQNNTFPVLISAVSHVILVSSRGYDVVNKQFKTVELWAWMRVINGLSRAPSALLN